jgi:hypothetical protein
VGSKIKQCIAIVIHYTKSRPTNQPRRDPLKGVPIQTTKQALIVRAYLMKSISEYLGSGQRSSGTSFSKRSATSRTSSIAGTTVSRM